MRLSTQERILIEQRIANDARSPVVAYLLWFFLGALGAHRFYLGATGTGIAMLLLFVLSWLTIAAYVGAVLLVAFGIWWLIDASLIPGMVRSSREQLRQKLVSDAIMYGGDGS